MILPMQVNAAANGQLALLNGAAGVPAGTPRVGGWAIRAADNSGYVEDLGIGAVPAGSPMIAGVAFHTDGRMYVTTQAPAAGDAEIGGWRVRPDGAVRVEAAASGVVTINRWAFSAAQRGQVAIT